FFQPARDARAERDLRGYPLIGAQQLLRLPDRLEQHLGPEVLPEQLGLEYAIRSEISELFDLLTPRHEVPAAGRLDDLVYLHHAPRGLARRRAVQDLELLALVTRPPGDREPLLELLTRRAAQRIRRVPGLGMRRRAER